MFQRDHHSIVVIDSRTSRYATPLLEVCGHHHHHHHHQNYLPVIKSCQNATYTIKRNRAPSIISSADIRRDLHWLPINHRISYKISLLTWKALYTAEPSYLSELISPYVPARILRSSNTYLLSIPTGVTSHFSSRFFCFRTVNLELFTSTYSRYRQTLNVQASTKVTLLPVCFHCLVTLRQRL